MLNRRLVALCADATLPTHPTMRHPRTGEPVRAVGILPSGRVVWPVMGGDGTEGTPGGEGGPGGAGSGVETPPAAGVPQETVNAIVAREAEKAKNTALAQVATDLGVTIDEAKQIIAERKAADDAKRSEAERAADAWKAAQQGAEAIKAEAERERHEARLERALSKAGLDVDNDVMCRAGLAALDVPTDADAAAVTTAVEKLKTDAPALFTTSGGGVTPPPSSTPPHAPRPPAPSSSMAQAREKARGQVVALGLADATKSA